MPDTVQDLTLDVLKSIQAAIGGLRDEIAHFRDQTDDRFDRLEAQMKRMRRDQLGHLLLARSGAGSLTQRMDALEARVEALEHRSDP